MKSHFSPGVGDLPLKPPHFVQCDQSYCPCNKDVRLDTRVADAALDLLEALKRAEWSGRDGSCGVCGAKGRVSGHHEACAVRAAIAKAEGK
jgi:hypothetical protein